MKASFKDLPVIFLQPGEVFFSNKPVAVTTILGSCLSITMYCKKTKQGGISHCQLPYYKGVMNDSNSTELYKYVDSTFEKMLQSFRELNIEKEDLEIKMFGGGDVIATQHERKNPKTIGRQNIMAAIQSIEKYDLSVTTSDVGGKQGRKIIFLANTGEIYLKRIKTHGKD